MTLTSLVIRVTHLKIFTRDLLGLLIAQYYYFSYMLEPLVDLSLNFNLKFIRMSGNNFYYCH